MTLHKAREVAGPDGKIQCSSSGGGMHVINLRTVKTIDASLAFRHDWEVMPAKPVIRVFHNVKVEYNAEKTAVCVEGLPADFGMKLGQKYEMTLEEVSGGNEA